MCSPLFTHNADFYLLPAVGGTVVPALSDLVYNMIGVGSDAVTLNVLTGQVTVNKRGTYFIQIEVPYLAAGNPVHLSLYLNNAVSVFDVLVSAGSQLVFRTLLPLEAGSVLSVRNLSAGSITIPEGANPHFVFSRFA
jgi:hypothetical protein